MTGRTKMRFIIFFSTIINREPLQSRQPSRQYLLANHVAEITTGQRSKNDIHKRQKFENARLRQEWYLEGSGNTKPYGDNLGNNDLHLWLPCPWNVHKMKTCEHSNAQAQPSPRPKEHWAQLPGDVWSAGLPTALWDTKVCGGPRAMFRTWPREERRSRGHVTDLMNLDSTGS